MATPTTPLQNEGAELITDVLKRRLSVLGISTSSIAVPPEDPDVVFHVHSFINCADVVFHVHSSINCADVVLIRAHSSILTKDSDYFREILQSQLQASQPTSSHSEDLGFSGCKNSHTQDLDFGATGPEIEVHDDSAAQFTSDVQEIAGLALSEHQLLPGTDEVMASNDGANLATISRKCPTESLDTLRGSMRKEEEFHIEQNFQTCFQTPVEGVSTSTDNVTGRAYVLLQVQPLSSSSKAEISSTNEIERKASTIVSDQCNQQRRSQVGVDVIPVLLTAVRRSSVLLRARQKSVRFSVLPAEIIPFSADEATATTTTGTLSKQDFCSNVEKGDTSTLNNLVVPKHMNEGEKISTFKAQYFARHLIKRRHTEVFLVEQPEGQGNKTKLFVIKKLTWTAAVLVAILEWQYLGVCHVNLIDLPDVYDAAYKTVMTGLTWCIQKHPMPQYLNLALSNGSYCQSLLELCLLADCKELKTLKCFCEALQALNGLPQIVILETKRVPGRENFIKEGFYQLDGHPLCVLQRSTSTEFDQVDSLRDEEQFDDESNPLPSLKFARHLQHPSSPILQKDVSKQCQNTWRIVVLGADQAGAIHSFLNFAAMSSLKCTSILRRRQIKKHKKNQEYFKLQMVTRFRIGSILVEALSKAIPDGLIIKEKRGSGSVIKGPSYCTSIVLKGIPSKILLAAKAIPYDMMGRCALKIASPSRHTFSNIFSASHTLGVDLYARSIVLVKPLYVLIKVLEFMTRLNSDAYELPETERTFVELTEPAEPF